MSKYRINVRFETDDPKQAEAVKFLQSLEHLQPLGLSKKPQIK